MVLWTIVFAFAFALIAAIVLALGFGRAGPWASFWIFFLIIFLAAWAAGIWFTPFGPAAFGAYWLPILLFAFVTAMILGYLLPLTRPRPKVETISQVKADEAERAAMINVFFWVLVVGLALIIIVGYFARVPSTI